LTFFTERVIVFPFSGIRPPGFNCNVKINYIPALKRQSHTQESAYLRVAVATDITCGCHNNYFLKVRNICPLLSSTVRKKYQELFMQQYRI